MLTINRIFINDIRFPTSKEGHGSDAMHTDPDYSCVYVRIGINHTDENLMGHGLTFTIGRGTEVVLAAALALKPLVLNTDLNTVFNCPGGWKKFHRRLTCDSQLRWIGPEKGAIHLATAAIVNAIWDLWAKLQSKPLWQLLVDMEPKQLVDCIDFQYISDALTEQEAIEILKRNRSSLQERVKIIRKEGYPAYTTGVGWTGYDDQTRRQLCRKALAEGYTRFKVKVGSDNIEDDRHRLRIVREEIGDDKLLMVDANQKWDVPEAIERMKQLVSFNVLWIEEPTSPDDILGHKQIASELQPYGIKVATGEQCHNRVMFKQFITSGAMQYCQIDSCRMAGVNEVLAVILMAAKYGVPVCPHAGGVGLCEYVQHFSIWDYVAVTGTRDNRMIEYVPHLVEHFQHPARCLNGHYMVPEHAGYGCHIKQESIEMYEYPNGTYWKQEQQQQ
uniref:Mitochondrial enolase superfamily member 1 n=1 Tax=Dermatophagoides pteronyssinus TaxID=6956 RepID=A0A6P6Y377_DERPT|nr:mitochondrial enolase superfamily member 1-like [Dermatophagoides pteronyssinus]